MVKRSFIIIAALVLAAATAGCAAGPQEYVTVPAPAATQANETAAPVESTPMSTLTAEPTSEPTPEPTPAVQEATVGFVGDILMMTRQIADAKTETGYDFTESFLPMKSVFESVDIMCADFEGTFGGEEAGYTQPRETIAPATEENPNPTNPPMQSFSAPDELAKNLFDAGIDAVTTANNHAMDRDDAGLFRTINVLRAAGIKNAGTGGEEAALFGADLLRMYTRYAERHGYKAELMNENYTEKGGVKEVVLSLQGKGAYSRMKFESGVHRVQRVPETESQGRIHTSAATVAVLPEAEDVEVDINPNDLQIDTYRSGGAGGQHVNKTESAIRITHIPTGLVVQCQDERSQHKNRDKAMRVLKSRLLELYQSKAAEAEADERKSQVGSGDRSERIRTYNFPQSRVTDHRIGLTLYKLEAFLDGDMDEVIDALILAERTRQLSSAEE